jgi:hypothetical protein
MEIELGYRRFLPHSFHESWVTDGVAKWTKNKYRDELAWCTEFWGNRVIAAMKGRFLRRSALSVWSFIQRLEDYSRFHHHVLVSSPYTDRSKRRIHCVDVQSRPPGPLLSTMKLIHTLSKYHFSGSSLMDLFIPVAWTAVGKDSGILIFWSAGRHNWGK